MTSNAQPITSPAALWPSSWDCTPSVITLNGSFTLLNSANRSYLFNALPGKSILNGCAETLITSTQQLQANTLNVSEMPVEPFWQTITPIIFMLSLSVVLVYVFFLVSLMAHSRRPWLQRLAALSAVVSLTLAANLMWKDLERQHSRSSLYNANELRAIRTNTALKVLRIISNSVLWLAQVQVLIRLFPRHRDKIVIKWTGLCLIVLETVFAVLNDLVHPSPVNPKSTNALIPAIPVLAYIFHIALDVLYAVFVLFFTISSGRWRHAYALGNVLIALVSTVAISSPVVFFCLDIWNNQVKGWGDYVRWAGSVAATVLVWDWVDHIETRIVKDTKIGILGREVFEDEMHDGKKKNSNAKTRGDKTAIILRKVLHRKAVRDDDDRATDIELPTICHPLVKSNILTSPDESRSPTICSQTAAQHASTASEDDNTRSTNQTAAQHASTASEDDNTRSISRTRDSTLTTEQTSQHVRPILHSGWLHSGFSPGDYWIDEKSRIN